MSEAATLNGVYKRDTTRSGVRVVEWLSILSNQNTLGAEEARNTSISFT